MNTCAAWTGSSIVRTAGPLSRPSTLFSGKSSYYHYLYNLQGDVIGLVDNSGTLVVESKYNAWSSILGRTGSLVSTLGALNPFRYRGYIYDDETAMCYCRSRYYYPELQRFINADILLGKTGALFSHNLFAYCANNPVALVDPDGNLAFLVKSMYRFKGISWRITQRDIYGDISLSSEWQKRPN